jgi:hypothetical protein
MNNRFTTLFAILMSFSVLCAPATADAKSKGKPANFKDTCHCVGCHGEYRWDVKTDEEDPPGNVSNNLVPSQIGAWKGPGGIFDETTSRRGRENQWFNLTGRVSLVKIEVDGDLHIQLVDEGAADDSVNVVVEVPFGEPWCDIRETVFGWTGQDFPFKTQDKKFTLQKKPVVTVTGRAFYDAVHGGGDTSLNRRPVPNNPADTTKNVTIWEIHPVMTLNVIRE